MKLKAWKIDKELYEKTKTKKLSLYKFNPCDCGCTDNSGIGANLIFFGANLSW